MGKINVLSFEVANLIAAGEVVDRPASVIKELVENSIDAGADRITVEIQRGGVLFMRVTDNGSGIEPEDLPVAVRRHATSKIKSAEDLDGILTLGFRGEALAAICAVADVRIISKPRNREMGAFIEVNSGRVGKVSERGATDGTTIIVENLFANVPARLKFLKRDLTEGMAVCSMLEKIALSHPEIAFKLIADGSVKLETTGDGNRLSALRSVYGKDFAKAMIEISAERDGVAVSGYITAPAAPRGNRNYQNFFINGRYIKTKTGMAAIEQAYTSYIPPEKFPGCVIYINIAPSVVDVNVHPGKLEVKFSNERPVFDAIYHAVRSALEQNSIRPEIGEIKSGRGAFSSSGFTPVSRAFTPVEDKALGEKPYTQIDISVAERGVVCVPEPLRTVPACLPDDTCIFTEECRSEQLHSGSSFDERQKRQTSVATAEIPDMEVCETVPMNNGLYYRLVGEVFNSYILVERQDDMLMIDKHAAHERLIFEELKRASKSQDRNTQLTALPIEVMLMSDEIAAIEEFRAQIEAVGFGFRTARNTVYIDEIPMNIPLSAAASMFEAFADQIKKGSGDVSLTAELIFEKALYQASCKAAIKAGRVYPPDYAEWLVAQLRENPEIICCPHGRPIAIVMTRSAINRMFKRE